MKLLPVAWLAPTLVLAFLSSGCESAGHVKAQSTGLRMDELRTTLVSARQKARSTTSALASLVEKADVDPKPIFATYKKELAAFEAAVDDSERHLKALSDGTHEYFIAWEQQATTMKDADLKRAAEERRSKLSKALDEVTAAMDQARPDISALTSTLQDMQIYLDNDLTPTGIQSVGSKVKQLGKSAERIGEKLDGVVRALEKGAPQFKTAGPPPAPTTPTKESQD